MLKPVEWLLRGFSVDLGIDLGTANTLVFVRDKGIVLDEPSVVAVRKGTSEVLLNGMAVGDAALEYLGRCPPGFQLSVAGKTITDELLTYRLIQENEALGLELFIDSDLDKQAQTLVGFLSLDQRLGEYDVATGLKWIEFASGRPTDALPIAQLAQDFDTRRAFTRH